MNIAIASAGELYGGAEQFIFDFASFLKRMPEHSVRIILFASGLLEQKLRAEGVPVSVIAPAFKYDWTAIGKVRELLRGASIRIVHTHGYKANLFCSFAARDCGVKVVKTEHGAMESFETFLERAKMRANLALDRAVTRRRVQHIVFVSKNMQADMQAGYAPVPSSVIYNGIPQISLDAARPPDEFQAGKVHLGIVGRLSPVKGHEFLFRAIQRIPEIPLQLHVFGEGELLEDLKRIARELKIADRLLFHGFKRDIHRYLRSLDILVMPSLHEGFPYTLLEASALGVPFIASEVGGIAEVFENGKDCLLAPPTQVNALETAIRTLIRDPDLRRKLSGNAQAKVNRDFTLDAMGHRYLELFSKLEAVRV